MGNCLRSSNLRSQVHDEEQDQFEFQNTNINSQEKKLIVNGDSDQGMKVKIVLTKEELEWLMYELKLNNHNTITNGGAGRSSKKLEEALAEIERNRALKAAISNNSCWQPSLESISEEVDESER